MTRKSVRLAREINATLGNAHATKRLPSDLRATFKAMLENAEIGAGENLYLGRRDLGYEGDPKEFRFSQVYARHFPGAKYDRLTEIIEEYSQQPHPRLGRKLTAREADRLGKEALRILDEDRALYRVGGAP